MKILDDDKTPTQTAIVVYTDSTQFWFLRLLRPGFRHCFVIVSSGAFWVVVDGLCHKTAVSVLSLEGLTEYLVQIHRVQGRCQVTRVCNDTTPRIRLLPYTCVESVKRILGVDSYFVLAPFLLYRKIRKNFLDKRRGLLQPMRRRNFPKSVGNPSRRNNGASI